MACRKYFSTLPHFYLTVLRRAGHRGRAHGVTAPYLYNTFCHHTVAGCPGHGQLAAKQDTGMKHSAFSALLWLGVAAEDPAPSAAVHGADQERQAPTAPLAQGEEGARCSRARRPCSLTPSTSRCGRRLCRVGQGRGRYRNGRSALSSADDNVALGR